MIHTCFCKFFLTWSRNQDSSQPTIEDNAQFVMNMIMLRTVKVDGLHMVKEDIISIVHYLLVEKLLIQVLVILVSGLVMGPKLRQENTGKFVVFVRMIGIRQL